MADAPLVAGACRGRCLAPGARRLPFTTTERRPRHSTGAVITVPEAGLRTSPVLEMPPAASVPAHSGAQGASLMSSAESCCLGGHSASDP